MYEHIFAESPTERAQRYRQLALAAEETAAHQPLSAVRAAYQMSAERWNKLASIMELGIGHEPRKISKTDYGKPPKKAKGWTIHKQQSGLPQAVARYVPEAHARAQDGEQGKPEVAAADGAGVRRPVLGSRGGLGRASSLPVRRARAG